MALPIPGVGFQLCLCVILADPSLCVAPVAEDSPSLPVEVFNDNQHMVSVPLDQQCFVLRSHGDEPIYKSCTGLTADLRSSIKLT